MSTCTKLTRMNYSMNFRNVLELLNITFNLLELDVYCHMNMARLVLCNNIKDTSLTNTIFN